MIKLQCDGCGTHIKDVLSIPIEGKMRRKMWGDPSRLRNPYDADVRLQPQNFHWCDECANVAVAAVRALNEAKSSVLGG